MFTTLLLAALAAKAPCPDCPATLPAVVSEARVAKSRQPDQLVELDLDELRRRRAALDIAEALAELPGVIARQRYNQAQDTQIQIRGFGARSPFGVRGLRIEYDGIPATAADGQSQIGHLDIGSGRMRLIRGPFAALYGNGGGYLRIDGARRAGYRLHSGLGSHGQQRLGFDLGGGEDLSFGLSGNRYQTDGVRAHSSAQRSLASARVAWQISDSAEVLLNAHHQDQPDAQDPQGQTRLEFGRDPFAGSPAAVAFDTRKSTRQSQFGARYRQDFGNSELQVAAYGGQRSIDQVLSVSLFAQAQASSGGGIVDLNRDYAGWSMQWQQAFELPNAQLQLNASWRQEQISEDRRGFENFIGSRLGVRGALRRDERNRGSAHDGMLRLDLLSNAWRWSAGVRRSDTRYVSSDRYLRVGNPDDSGQYRDDSWLPVLGFAYQMDPYWQLHAAFGHSQELPTLAELAYRNDGDGGFNTLLNPAKVRQAELGLQFDGEAVQADVSLFQAQVDDEIVVASSQGGRTSFQNAGATRRRGVEIAGHWQWTARWRAQALLNWIDARYSEAYSSCRSPPCSTPTVIVDAGTRLPGVPPRAARFDLSFASSADLSTALEWQALAATPASDRNRDSVPGYAVWNLRMNRRFAPQSWGRLNLLARVDNLLDRRYSGSLIVNEGARRYYEAAPGRGFWLGLDLALP